LKAVAGKSGEKDAIGAEKSAILTVYFVQGALGISALARSFFLKDDLGISPAESAAILGAASLPWAIKPLYGFLSDSLPILGYRRRYVLPTPSYSPHTFSLVAYVAYEILIMFVLCMIVL